MITSFFAPKSKRGDSSSKKRQRTDENVDTDPVRTSRTKIGSSAASSTPLTEETATLLSFLHRHGDVEGEGEGAPAAGITSWRTALEEYFTKASFTGLAKFVAKERASKTVYPPPDLTFAALNLTPLHKVKVVVVGQDPYHQPNQGHGLSFSVPRGIKIPPSLRNIYKELSNDDQVAQFTAIPRHGNLEQWAAQGVLLLNNVLTVRRGEAASHAKRGWEQFTDRVIEAVIERDAAESHGKDDGDESRCEDEDKGTGVVFLLWGKPASLKAQTVLKKYNHSKCAAKHAVITCSHPSPLGATKTTSPFMGSHCFSRANEELEKRGWRPIDWRVE